MCSFWESAVFRLSHRVHFRCLAAWQVPAIMISCDTQCEFCCSCSLRLLLKLRGKMLIWVWFCFCFFSLFHIGKKKREKCAAVRWELVCVPILQNHPSDLSKYYILTPLSNIFHQIRCTPPSLYWHNSHAQTAVLRLIKHRVRTMLFTHWLKLYLTIWFFFFF